MNQPGSGPIHDVRAGFIPLVDAAPVIVAYELGYAESEGIRLILNRETSWAAIRDRLAVSHLDAAHILAPMPIAANLGLGPLPVAITVPMALGSGANSITVSHEIWNRIACSLDVADFDAQRALDALVRVVAERRADNRGPLSLGVVHPYSAHYYELSYWLASGGIPVGEDIELVVLPPGLMPAALASGQIDGFCAGEPWGTVAANDGTGVILTTNAHIWRNSPEKVLGVRRAFAEEDPARLAGLVRALYRAAAWCDLPESQEALALLLARPEYVGRPVDQIRPCLARRLRSGDGAFHPVEGFLNFSRNAATFPWTSHALWFYSQMVRWGQATPSEDAAAIARDTYRPDLYRAALKPLGVPLPAANAKVEGALRNEQHAGAAGEGQLLLGPDAFFDGRVFDPDRIDAYLAEQS